MIRRDCERGSRRNTSAVSETACDFKCWRVNDGTRRSWNRYVDLHLNVEYALIRVVAVSRRVIRRDRERGPRWHTSAVSKTRRDFERWRVNDRTWRARDWDVDFHLNIEYALVRVAAVSRVMIRRNSELGPRRYAAATAIPGINLKHRRINNRTRCARNWDINF